MRNRSGLILELTSTRMELRHLRAGRVHAAYTERYNPPAPGTDLAEVLRPRHATLRQWVAEHGHSAQPVTVVFSTPTTTCALLSVPAAAGETAIERAARLALGELAGYAIFDHPSDTCTLAIDSAPLQRAGAGASQQLAHTLAAVEQEATCQLISSWVSSCGLRVADLRPAGAAPIARAVAHALASPTITAALWFGEHDSYLAVGSAQGLRLFRPLGIGVESLVEALQRPITPRTQATLGAPGPGAEVVQLDRAGARSLLTASGIPQPADIIDQRQGLTGAAVLPLLSPVVQRASIELKQSLRFGLVEADRQGIHLHVLGPGARVPNLHTLLAQQAGIEPGAPEAQTDTAVYSLLDALCTGTDVSLSLLPAPMREARTSKRASRSLLAGIAGAAAVVLVYAGYNHTALLAVRAQAESLKAQAERARQADEQRRSRQATSASARRAATHLVSAIAPAPDWASVLYALGDATPASTTLSSVDLTAADGPPTLRISGSMLAPDDRAFAQQLQRYIQSLQQLPLVASVKMGGTSRAASASRRIAGASPSTPAGDAFSFELTCTLVALPYAATRPEALAPLAPAIAGATPDAPTGGAP